ncbi:MAG: double-strand break repair protein AddB [Hyphomicrobiales bacterium]
MIEAQQSTSFGKMARVATIAPQHDFLSTLIDALFDGRLLPDFSLTKDTLADNPFYLADFTLFLPTRRAVRAAEDAIVKAVSARTGGEKAALLPQIRAIGDTDEADLMLQDSAADPISILANLPPAMPDLERHVALTEMVWAWSRALVKRVAALEPYEAVIIPASPADAASLASDLAGLMDEAENQGVNWADLKNLVPDDFAKYWQLSLSFLEIVTNVWPEHLQSLERIDGMARRNKLIKIKTDALIDQAAKAGPTIAAGSTGSVPVTAALLKAIADLPRGCVVLPGLDLGLDNRTWEAIGLNQDKGGHPNVAALGHPQAVLKETLSSLGVSRNDVMEHSPSGQIGNDTRYRLLNEALRPAETTEQWAAKISKETQNSAISKLCLIEARTPQEEALAIALTLREALESPNQNSVALVTPDRTLARRVSVELMRFGIVADDSAGQPLFATPAGTLARLVLETARTGAALPLLALLKHPLCGLGETRVAIRKSARALERAILRGPALSPGTLALHAALSTQIQDLKAEKKIRLSASQRSLKDTEWYEALWLTELLQNTLSDFETYFSNPNEQYPLNELIAAHLSVIQHCVGGDETAAQFATSEDGSALISALLELRDLGADGRVLQIRSAEYAELLQVLVGSRPVRRRQVGSNAEPRVQILGTLEARLLHADRVVLAGLNEKSWPGEPKLDPWLSRNMRARLGFTSPEQSIGLSAHDFVQLASKPDVVLTRSIRQDGAPTQASRWLQRIEALIGEEGQKTLVQRGQVYLAIARQLDLPEFPSGKPVPRPFPVPEVKFRPNQLSVTEIETLIRDPYAIYAKHILKLAPFDAIGETPNFATRGTIVHDILNEFLKLREAGFDTRQAVDELNAIADQHFDVLADYPDLYARWRTRFQRIAGWFLEHEAKQAARIQTRHTERDGFLELKFPDFRLRGRADRIDILQSGLAEIIDYKTGQPPSKTQVEAQLAPQLSLEAAMVSAGAFAGIPAIESDALSYIRLSGNRVPGAYIPVASGIENVNTLANEALQKLQELVAYYAQPETGYLSQAQPQTTRYEGAYDHLARVSEWRGLAGDEDGQE